MRKQKLFTPSRNEIVGGGSNEWVVPVLDGVVPVSASWVEDRRAIRGAQLARSSE